MARRRTAAVLTMSLAALVSSCGGSDDEVAGDAVTTSGLPDGSVASATTAPAPPDTDGDNGADGENGENGENGGGDPFEYVPWGPDDGLIPQEYDALAASDSEGPDCDEAGDNAPPGEFWAFALEICRALSGAGEWPAQTSVPPPPEPLNPFQQCLDDELSAMMVRAVDWHASHPGAPPAVAFPEAGSDSTCVTQISARIAEEYLGQFPAGSLLVAITAPGLEDDPTVEVDGVPVPISDEFFVDPPAGFGLDSFVAVVPVPPETHEAIVEITTRYGRPSTTVTLPGADATATTVPPSSDDTVTSTDAGTAATDPGP